MLVFEAHQHEVADQVRLAELPPRRVHALEDQLRVVLIATQRDVHDDELGEPVTQTDKVALQTLDLGFEECKVLLDSN
jgi:hypothetical protein